MKRIYRLLLLVILMFALVGCCEDISEITLNADGSGRIKQKFVLSERFVVAMSDESSKSDIPVSDEELKKTIGTALDNVSLKQTEMGDGSRIIEVEGTFKTAEQFFLSDFCRAHFKMRFAKVDENTAAIYSQLTDGSSDMGPSANQLYGIAKGMYIKRKINLPTKIIKSNGEISKDGKTVTWSVDLRDKQSFDKSKPFLEEPHKGKGNVLFDISGFGFNVPQLAANKSQSDKTGKSGNDKESSDVNANVVWIKTDKKHNIENNTTEIARVEIGVELTWEDKQPVAYTEYKLTSLTDDAGNDMVRENYYPSRRDIHKSRDKEVITFRAKEPGKSVKELRNLQGYIDVVTGSNVENIVLDNIHDLAGKDSTGNEALDKINFKIISIKGSSFKISAEEGNNFIPSMKLLRADGSNLKSNGSMGMGDTYTYNFESSLDDVVKCMMEVITSEEVVRVPFSLDRISLP